MWIWPHCLSNGLPCFPPCCVYRDLSCFSESPGLLLGWVISQTTHSHSLLHNSGVPLEKAARAESERKLSLPLAVKVWPKVNFQNVWRYEAMILCTHTDTHTHQPDKNKIQAIYRKDPTDPSLMGSQTLGGSMNFHCSCSKDDKKRNMPWIFQKAQCIQ